MPSILNIVTKCRKHIPDLTDKLNTFDKERKNREKHNGTDQFAWNSICLSKYNLRTQQIHLKNEIETEQIEKKKS